MAEQGERFKPHFVLTGRARGENFRTPNGGGPNHHVAARDRHAHGSELMQQFDELAPYFDEAKQAQRDAGVGEGFGLRLTFESFPGVEVACQSLAAEGSGIELLNVRQDGERTFATVFVPDGKLDILVNKLRKYLHKGTDDKPPNAALWNTVAAIKAAAIKDLWTDTDEVFPAEGDTAIWWEVWLPVRKNRQGILSQFRQLAEKQGLRLANGELTFPERTVLMAHGTLAQMQDSLPVLNHIAALRRAKETAEFFDALEPEEQPAWMADLLARLAVPGENEDVPHVCLLDTGVNHGHPLLQVALKAADTHTVEPAWGKNDSSGHGTNMAGLALLGDLTPLLASSEPAEVGHRLESVKLVPADHTDSGDSHHFGYLTMQAVSYPEVSDSGRKRIYSMAITANDHRDAGAPTAWSSAVDELAVGDGEAAERSRLIVLAAGNTTRDAWADYPEANKRESIQDPAQSWNALTVGAMTHLTRITEDDADDYEAVARGGDLSPYSTTSCSWSKDWPLKPDVVFEGGNVATSALGPVWMRSLCLLTTNALPEERLLDVANATSAASALAARMAAQLMRNYPHLSPESVRGLIVHSAQWTPAMIGMFVRSGSLLKGDWIKLVQCCGFGEPNLERARWSMDNSLTLICEDQLQPFQREGSHAPTLNEMNLHQLPWPVDALRDLGDTEVEMRVTLSYFIEPNPSQRPPKSKYRYESHGLRFEVMRATEPVDDFRGRINKAAQGADYEKSGGSDDGWRLGSNGRVRGSIHSDIWTGSAADLASRDAIAVYPVSGWWKTRHGLKKHDRVARYSLLVSIRAPEVDVDLYTPVANAIRPVVTVET